MRVVLAAGALFLDVGNLAIGRDFPVMAGDASASERGETEQTDKAHHVRTPNRDRASLVPKSSIDRAIGGAVRGRRNRVFSPLRETRGGTLRRARCAAHAINRQALVRR